jgi:hypothetical protein
MTKELFVDCPGFRSGMQCGGTCPLDEGGNAEPLAKHTKGKKFKNNQHPEFANGHPLNYYSSGMQLKLPERTGRLFFCILWSIAEEDAFLVQYIQSNLRESLAMAPIISRGV